MKTIYQNFLKALFVGVAYSIVIMIAGMLVRVIGLPMPNVSDAQTRLLWSFIGGLVPLTLQVSALPLYLPATSAVEIFFQNFLTGVATARLMGIENLQ